MKLTHTHGSEALDDILVEQMEPQSAAIRFSSKYTLAWKLYGHKLGTSVLCAMLDVPCMTTWRISSWPCHLADINRQSGYPIVNIGYDKTNSKYCCGSVVDNKCQDGDPFTIKNGAVIPGVAALAGYVNASSITSTTCSDSSSITSSSSSSITNTTCPTPTGNNLSLSSHTVAIRVGFGMPLGVITLASIAWALWERRQCKYARLESMPAIGEQATGQYQHQYPPHGVYQAHPAELGTRQTRLVSELDSNGDAK
ncbi:hypothetical protein IFM47457_06304 [Aspergillus lentulus]|nr:hypothetical protein IFM47457_06304 [Aspergillus lentulus]